MINCAHPTHFEHVLERDVARLKRLRGLRARFSRRSYELDNSPELAHRNPAALGAQYGDLLRRFPRINVFLAGAVERTTGMWNASAWPAKLPPEQRTWAPTDAPWRRPRLMTVMKSEPSIRSPTGGPLKR